MLIFFVIVFIFGLSAILLITLFAPEILPWFKPHLILERSEIKREPKPPAIQKPQVMEGLIEQDIEFNISLKEKIERLEVILHEKNKILEKLQTQLDAEREHRHEFEKVREMLIAQIESLKNKNKELKTSAKGGSASG